MTEEEVKKIIDQYRGLFASADEKLRERLMVFARRLAAEQWSELPSTWEPTVYAAADYAVARAKADIGRALLEMLEQK